MEKLNINEILSNVINNKFSKKHDLIKFLNGQFIDNKLSFIELKDYQIYLRFSNNKKNIRPTYIVIYKKYKSYKSDKISKELILDMHIENLSKERVKLTYLYMDIRANNIIANIVRNYEEQQVFVTEKSVASKT